MPLLEKLKELARSMNIPSGWWIVGLTHDNTIIKVACFLGEHTAKDWGHTHKDNMGYLVTKL